MDGWISEGAGAKTVIPGVYEAMGGDYGNVNMSSSGDRGSLMFGGASGSVA
jgi:hypothetical protein